MILLYLFIQFLGGLTYSITGRQHLPRCFCFSKPIFYLLAATDIRSECDNTVESRYLEVDGTILYMFKLPAVRVI